MISQEQLTELEIAAFMGPHIKRARIALFVIGALYMLSAYLSYGDIVRLREMIERLGSERLQDRVDLIFIFVVATGIVGAANMVLAAIAGQKTTVAMYTATALFVAHATFQLYVVGGAMMFSIVWWFMAICIGMGFQAVWKAEKLRKERGLVSSPG